MTLPTDPNDAFDSCLNQVLKELIKRMVCEASVVNQKN